MQIDRIIEDRVDALFTLRGGRMSAMDDYGNIRRALEKAENVTKNMSKLLKPLWEAAVDNDTVARDAVLQRFGSVAIDAAVAYADLAAEIRRAETEEGRA